MNLFLTIIRSLRCLSWAQSISQPSAYPLGDIDLSDMEALVFDGKTRTLEHRTDYAVPRIISPDDVIVKVVYSGICGTDLHIIHGEFPALTERPFPLGHEFCGVVHEVGDACVLKVGQRVVVDPNRPCNLCEACRRARYQFCSRPVKCNLGVFADGGWAQYVKAPQDQVFALPDQVTLEQGGLCEPYSCVSHGYDRASPLYVGDKILILGAGIIGNLWITTLHHQGHRNVTVSEMNKNRLEIVKKLDTGFRLVTPDILESEKELFNVIIDCTGVGKVMETSTKYLSSGGKYVVFGCCPPTHSASLNPYDIFDKELTIVGVKVNPFSFPTAISWLSAMGDRYLNYEKLGVKVYKMADYKEALADLKIGVISKAILKID